MHIRQSNAGTTGSGTAGSISTSLPSATLTGTILFLLLSTDFTVSTPAGWTLDRSQVNNNAHYVFRKTASGGESSWNITLGNGAAIAAWAVIEAQGLIASPLDVVASGGSGTAASTRPTGTTAATAQDNESALATWGTLPASGATTPAITFLSSGGSVLDEVFTTRSGNYNVGLAYTQWSATVAGFGYSDTATFAANTASTGIIAVYKTAAAVYEQHSYRFRNDDGDEDGATWAAPVNTNTQQPVDTIKRLRFLIDTTNDAPSTQYQLEYRKVGDPTWTKVS